jgi:hypothetical protein
MTPAQLDECATAHEREWGIGRLPRLVSEQTATRFQAALDMLAADSPPAGATWEQVRASIARGWAAMAQEARAAGHAPLPPPVAEAEWERGKIFAVALSDEHRQALTLRAKAEGRQHYSVWTVAELAVLIRSIPIVSTIKDMFPDAEVLPPRLPPVGKVPRDEIPFGDWGAGERQTEAAV